MSDFFGDIAPVSYNPDAEGLAYRHYNPDEVVAGKRMEVRGGLLAQLCMAGWRSVRRPDL